MTIRLNALVLPTSSLLKGNTAEVDGFNEPHRYGGMECYQKEVSTPVIPLLWNIFLFQST